MTCHDMPRFCDCHLALSHPAGKKYFAYGKMTVVLGETIVTIIVAQLMCLVLGGQKRLICNMGMWHKLSRSQR